MTPCDCLIVGVGYLGREVALRWAGGSNRVVGTTRHQHRFGALEELGIRPVVWDVLDPGAGQLPSAETVLYCVGFDRSLGVPIHNVYVDGLRATLEQLPPCRRFIYVSSTGVYGDAAGGWVDESTLPAPTDVAGRACLEAERVLAHAARQRGMDTVVLRLAGLYGPGRFIGVEALREQRAIEADPDAHLNLIHVEDAATVVTAGRARAEQGGVYLVSDGHPVRRRAFYEYAASLLNSPPPKFAHARSRRSRGDRRISNARMLTELHVKLAFADYRQGLADCLGRHSTTGES
jgi:nucleoside-diphosphate-sugar epimerase